MKPKEAIELLENLKVCKQAHILFNVEKEAVDLAIEALKEPKQGEWKRISMDKYIRHASCFYRCSVCGEDTIGEVNFCPNCGADMRGDEK